MLSSFALRIHRTILRRALLNSGDRVLVAVSGGADSVALARVLHELGYTIGIAHLNHVLRGRDSNGDERFVAELASQLGAPFYSSVADIRVASGNIEEAARNARREFFERITDDAGFEKIALGHTQDDRTETFLLNLVRGAGLEGLVSMRPKIGEIIRPLIDVGKADVEAYLQSLGQPWRTDLTNADLRFARNRLRHQFIPSLTRSFNPRLGEALHRTVDVLDDENLWMQDLAREWMTLHAEEDSEGIALDAVSLRDAPVALARRVIRESIRRSGVPLTGVSFVHIDGIRALAEDGKSGKVAELPGGAVARRDFERIVFSRRVAPPEPFAYDLPVPGAVRAPSIGRIFRASIVEVGLDPGGSVRVGSAQQHAGAVFVDGERLGPYVRIRPWQPGDYYRPAGRPAGKLKKLFQQARIPRSQRRGWPVFVTDSGIVWVASFPVSREFAPCERSQKIVALEALSDSSEVSG